MSGWLLFEIAVNFFQAGMMVYFLDKQLKRKKNYKIAYVACLLSLVGVSTVYLLVDISIPDTILFLLPLIFGFICFEDKWHIVLFWNIVLALVFGSVANLASTFYITFMGTTWEDLMNETSLRIAFVISSNLMMLLSIMTIIKLTSRSWRLPIFTFLLLLILNAICLVAMEMLFSIIVSEDADSIFLWVCGCLFAISVVSIVLYEVISDNAKKQHLYRLEIDRLNTYSKYSQEVKSMYDDMAQFQHDITHHLQTISSMVPEHNDVAMNHIDQLYDRFREIQPYSTGSTAVDALLTAKVSLMRHKGIGFSLNPYPLDELPIVESEFCAILGNLLDNAIEGVERIQHPDEPQILLAFARSWDMFYVTCTNPYDRNSLRHAQGAYLSSKTGNRHGIGTHSMNALARKANGYVRFRPDDKFFHVDIVLPFRSSVYD